MKTIFFLLIPFLGFSQIEINPTFSLDQNYELNYGISLTQSIKKVQFKYVEIGALNNEFYASTGLGYKIGNTYSIIPSLNLLLIRNYPIDLKGNLELRSERFKIGFGLIYSRIFFLEQDLFGAVLTIPLKSIQ